MGQRRQVGQAPPVRSWVQTHRSHGLRQQALVDGHNIDGESSPLHGRVLTDKVLPSLLSRVLSFRVLPLQIDRAHLAVVVNQLSETGCPLVWRSCDAVLVPDALHNDEE